MLFMVQIGIYSFHELSEAGVFPNSEVLHDATEPFSPTGLYGRWFSLIAIGACTVWLGAAWISDAIKKNSRSNVAAGFSPRSRPNARCSPSLHTYLRLPDSAVAPRGS